ncbi:MAG: NAD-dependent epimerase/dehydratase family protein [Nitrospinales bacterium]
MITGSTFFITGGAGFIGSWIIEQVIENNQVVVYDNCHRNALQYTPFMNHSNLKFIKGDILRVEELQAALPAKCDYVIHLAGIAGVPTVVKHPALTLQVNLIGTYNILNLLPGRDIKRFIDFSTSEVYGPHVFRASEDGMTTQGPLSQPRWVYAVSKLASEYLTHSYYREHGLPIITIRPFNVYGPRQVGEGAIHHFILRAIKNENVIVHGNGDSIRSWCYVSDIVDAVLAVCENDNAVGEHFNIGNPQATGTTLELAKKIINLSESRSKIELREIDYPDVEVRVPSITKAKKLFGYEPKIDYETGIRKTIEWYRGKLKDDLQ